jgi:hypothetical protein
LEAVNTLSQPVLEEKRSSTLTQLPNDILVDIASYLDVKSLVLFASVSTQQR